MKTTLHFFVAILISCTSITPGPPNQSSTKPIIDPTGTTIQTRFAVPEGFERTKIGEHSFGNYLRNLPLKPDGSMVNYYDGTQKTTTNVYAAVVDMDLDKLNLQQCADAVMRLRGEYLFKENRIREIKFNYLSDGKPRYFNEFAKGDFSYANFRKYMIQIFSYANTASLRAELKQRPIMEMEIGDVLVQKGRPYGHAVIVVDMAINQTTGEKIYMLAQSYMPAQDTQILLNPMNKKLSPWYQLGLNEIMTPEWPFVATDLRHF